MREKSILSTHKKKEVRHGNQESSELLSRVSQEQFTKKTRSLATTFSYPNAPPPSVAGNWTRSLLKRSSPS